VLDVAAHYGGDIRNEFICMAGVTLAALRRLVKPYSGARYVLTGAGVARQPALRT
jgi:hypothetical protein